MALARVFSASALSPALRRIRLQSLDNRGEAEQFVRIVLRQPIGRVRQGRRIAQILREIGAPFMRVQGRIAQGFERGMRRIDRLQPGGIAIQPLRLFGKAKADGIEPFYVGPPVHVVTDPAGEAERDRGQFMPAFGMILPRRLQHIAHDPVSGILRMGYGPHRAIMFVGQL